MNLQEFAALKPGDRIRSMFGAAGTIAEATQQGVRVRWGDLPASPTFAFSVNSTAWMHWSRDDESQP